MSKYLSFLKRQLVSSSSSSRIQFKQMDSKLVTILAMIIGMLWLGIQETEGRPSYSSGWDAFDRHHSPSRRTENICTTLPEVRELCQRCAKATKSTYAYPMCCKDVQRTLQWCTDFLNFGLTNQQTVNYVQ